jgi:hypothetical protein
MDLQKDLNEFLELLLSRKVEFLVVMPKWNTSANEHYVLTLYPEVSRGH